MANPPFHEEGKATPSPNVLKAQAHAFGAADLDLWIKVLHGMVRARGTVTLVYKAEAVGSLLQFMEERFGNVRVAPLHPRHGAAAKRVIVQGVKGSKAPTQLLHGLVLHGADGRFTAEAEEVLRHGAAWPLR
jgi:tRNA1(Val) A37 N6-methylase TrmN6